MSRKLLIVLLCVALVLTACQSKIPDGVSKEFYNDMQGILSELVKEVNSNKNADFNIYKQSSYKKLMKMSNDSNYVGKEIYILDYTVLLYSYLGFYYDGMTEFESDIEEVVSEICELMEIKFDTSKIIK